MNKFGDKQYLIISPKPSKIFLRAFRIAGEQLQKQFNANNLKSVQSSYDGFKWLKSEITHPSFDNLTFAYKNSVFSVVIEIIDKISSTFTKEHKEHLLKVCEANNLIPCTFKLKLIFKDSNYLGRLIGNKEKFDYELMPLEQGWNLYDVRTSQKINPLNMASDEKIRMSEWELSNFAIQIVKDYMKKEGNEIISFCDLTDINPQIWFKNKEGEIGWVIAKHIKNDSDLDYRKWVGLEEKSPFLKQFDGYFASVQFYSVNTNSRSDLYRGDGMYVRYIGLERIYVA